MVLQNQEFNSTLRWLTLLEQQGFQVEDSRLIELTSLASSA